MKSVNRAALVGVCVGILCAPPLALAQERTQSRDDIREQGVLYFKKDMFIPAKRELDRAYAMPGGPEDFAVVYYRGQAAYKLLLLEEAFEMARAAERLGAENERNAARARDLLNELSSLYGGITFIAAKGETNKKGRIFFEAKTGIINKEKVQRFNAIRDRFMSTDVELPTTVYLPFGDYLANKVPFSLAQGEEAQDVEIFLQVVVGEGDDSAMWWYVGIGSAIALGLGVGAFFLFQKPDDEVRFEQTYDFQGLTVRP